MNSENVRTALRRILASDGFQASQRCSSLLSYIVEEHLAGNNDKLNGACIAQDVFGRDETFDSNSDPLVRVQAGRLRKLLDAYYAGPGADDELVISVPRGGYTPRFEEKKSANQKSEQADPASAAIAGPLHWRISKRSFALGAGFALLIAVVVAGFAFTPWRTAGAERIPSGPRIYIEAFEASDDNENASAMSLALQIGLIDGLSRFKNLFVYGAGTTNRQLETFAIGGDFVNPDFVLSGAIEFSEQRLSVTSQLAESEHSIVVWSKTYAFENVTTAEIVNVKADIIKDVSAALGQPYGVIDSYLQRLHAQAEHIEMPDYYCLLSFYDYARSKSAEKHGHARDCLKAAVDRSPGWSMGWAALSWIYGDEVRYGYNPEAAASPASERALKSAQNAVEADPYNATAHVYLSNAYFLAGRDREAVRHAEHALDINPNDSEALISAANILMVLENSARGRDLAEKAITLNPGHPPWFNHGLTIYYYVNGDGEQALAHARRYAEGGSAIAKLLLTAALARYGEADDAEKSLNEFETQYPDESGDVAKQLRAWRLPDKTASMILNDIDRVRSGESSS